jgi:thiamine biosynthesis lipoprotein
VYSPPTPCTSPAASTSRARPLLGTIVSIRLDGLPRAQASEAIERGFAEVELVQRLMSFHEDASDVSRLNREAVLRPVRVHPHTYEVVRCAQVVAAGSGGVFDISVAGRLVEWGILPAPPAAQPPDAGASWRDIELGPDGTLRFHRPLWIDLGGIAKGFAVDRAIAAMAAAGPPQCVVNAGGDMRVAGAARERVLLDAERGPDADVPVLEIENASLASSSGVRHRRRRGERAAGPHVHGRTGAAIGRCSFVSVLAPTCMVADALTKVVLAQRMRAVPVLEQFGAAAYWHNVRLGWRAITREPRSPEEHLQ